jgi:asparagine synthase (glutamine-hydrolysing)
MDVRMIRFLLALPTLPWCIQKRLLRDAGSKWLPEPVRTRPKSPLAQDPAEVLSARLEYQWIDHFEPVPKLLDYVQIDRVPLTTENASFFQSVWLNLRPYSLNHWLKTYEQV